METAFPLLKCLRMPKRTRLQDFAITISRFFWVWYPSLPTPAKMHSVWTQAPIFAGVTSVPTVPVLQNDHWCVRKFSRIGIAPPCRSSCPARTPASTRTCEEIGWAACRRRRTWECRWPSAESVCAMARTQSPASSPRASVSRGTSASPSLWCATRCALCWSPETATNISDFYESQPHWMSLV